jgi:hypothetical protein
MKRNLFILFFMLVYPFLTFAGGTDGFEFLRMDLGSRVAAMGGASVAGAANLQDLIYNPASLAGLDDTQASFSYQNYLSDIQSGALAFHKRWSEKSNVAVHLAYLNYGTIDRTSPQGEQDGSFTPGDFALGASYASFISSRLCWGVNAKFIRSQLDQYVSNAAALDAGLLLHFPAQLMRIGLSVQNFGQTFDPFKETREKLPLAFRTGFAKRLAHLPLELQFDLIRYAYRESKLPLGLYWALGGEFTISDHFLMRWGYHSRGQEQRIGVNSERFAGVSFGVGFEIRKYQIDYALSSYGALGGVNTFTVTRSF